MATYALNYLDVGKGLQFDGGSTRILYGDDFNPTSQNVSSAEHCTVYQHTLSFDLDGFQPGHEVGACAIEVERSNADTGLTQPFYMDFQRYDGSRHTSWSYYDEWDWPNNDASLSRWRWQWCYFGVDKDEIWPGYSKYRIHRYAVDGSWDYYSSDFTVSNLSIDSTLHRSGFIWVDGRNLCYTDNTGDEIGDYGYGYKHRIAYDSSYSSSVGSSSAGYVWLDDTDILRIYYVDEYGTLRRTYSSRSRYGGNVNVGSSKAGYIRTGVWEASEGYGHLCFIAPNGSKRRILNGPPIGYS